MKMRFLLLIGLMASVLTACGGDKSSSKVESVAENAFVILASSEIKDLEADFSAAAKQAGVPVVFKYAGTLDIVDRINAGETSDAILPANGAYPSLALQTKPSAKDKLFYARIALGVKPLTAQKLGWDKKPPTWAAIAEASKKGQFNYAMTNPSTSNTGMSALFAVALALANKTEDLQLADIKTQGLQDFLQGQKLTAGSSGWLADTYLKESARLDGMINYESVLLQLNQKLPAAQQLQVIFPQDGVISADYPLMLLNTQKRAQYQTLINAWKSAAFQKQASQRAFIRPSNPDAPINLALSSSPVAELSFPSQLVVIDGVLLSYLNELRRPATSIFVLDISGSMEGDRIASLRDALLILSGTKMDKQASSRYSRFQSRENVIMLTFDDQVYPEQHFYINEKDKGESQYQAISQFAQRLEVAGGTAIYSAMDAAYKIALKEQIAYPERMTSIVLLTDGENREGLSAEQFARMQQVYRQESKNPIRVFPIVFGEADPSEMEALASRSGGKAFDGRSNDLGQIFKEIRSYQ